MPSALWGPEGGMHRLLQWHMPILGRRFRIPVRRGYPPGLHPYAGQTWMVLDRETARQLLEFTDAHPEIVRFHRHVWIPDEHHIQTVLHNCARKDALVKQNLWYTEWQPSDKHPRVFIEADYPRIAEAAARRSDISEALFARKFDLNRAPKIFGPHRRAPTRSEHRARRHVLDRVAIQIALPAPLHALRPGNLAQRPARWLQAAPRPD
jgi:hypothetical protein